MGFSFELKVLFKTSVSGELGQSSPGGGSVPSADGVVTISGTGEGSTKLRRVLRQSVLKTKTFPVKSHRC